MLAQEARKQGIDKDPAVQRTLRDVEERALVSALLEREVGPHVTDAAVKERFDKQTASEPPAQEVHARHILVEDEATAKKIIAELKKGADFATLSKQYSKDAAAVEQGGDLGYFKATDMVPEFSKAAFALKDNEVSPVPVHTQFGWHVIQTLDHRAAPAAELRPGERSVAPADDQRGSAQGARPGTCRCESGTVQSGRHADQGDRSGGAAAGEVTAAAWEAERRKQTYDECRFSRRRTRAGPRRCWKPQSLAGASPLAVALPELPPLAGVRLNATAAGIRYKERTDLVMLEVAAGSTVAGVFTSNKCPGAPVDWCRDALRGGRARLVVVNAGNANVFTGRAGRDACAATAAAAGIVGCAPSEVFVASTGVIGEVLPHDKLIAALPALHAGLRADAWEAAARGIMTTDTFPKASTRVAKIGGTSVRITGIAKGSGMIAPDMATMLCFVFTDAAIPRA